MNIKAAAGLLLLVGCGSGEPPLITSVTLSPSEVAPGGETTLTIAVDHFTLRAPTAGTTHGLRPAHGEGEGGDYPDAGHFHVYYDSLETNPLLLDCPDYCEHPGFASGVRVQLPDDAEPGAHELIVRLNADDHTFLTPPIQATAALTITNPN